jgi:hypothetical protein
METVPQAKNEADIADMSFIKDIVDIIKNKMLFFFPFFGAFLAFLIAKSDYVMNANWFIEFLCAATFLVGVFYAHTVSQALWVLESIRLVFTLEKITRGAMIASAPEKQRATIRYFLGKFGIIVDFEAKLFRRTMYLIYFTAANILFDLYFGKLLNVWTAKLARWALPLG